MLDQVIPEGRLIELTWGDILHSDDIQYWDLTKIKSMTVQTD
jgi:hypothetical protein